MIIAGLQNLSLVDFPGYLSSVVFVQGCNFYCEYCYNPDLITTEKHFEFSEKDAFDFFSRRKNMIEGVVISGGEPTLHKDLPGFIKRIKDMGFKIKLDTNGSNPGQLEELFRMWLLDYTAVDIKTSLRKYSLVTNQENIEKVMLRTIRLAMLSTRPYEFRTTCAPGIVEEEDFHMIGEVVKGAKKYCLQQFRPLITYNKNFQDVKPYDKKELEGFRSILKDFVEEVEIRGI